MHQKYTLSELPSFLRLMLMPLAWLHSGVLRLRHAAYDRGWLPSAKGALPTIALGNLTVGGTGKTPHALLLLEVAEGFVGRGHVAILSRGHGRQTKGFREVEVTDLAENVGDEPLMMKLRRPDVCVVVGEDRVAAIDQTATRHPHIRLIILDDALQHRRLVPTVRLLLVDATQPMGRDVLLPAGRLRDLRSRAQVADACLITRWPAERALTEADRRELGVPGDLPAFSSTMVHRPSRQVAGPAWGKRPARPRAMAIAGIARPERFFDSLADRYDVVTSRAYRDHGAFPEADIDHWRGELRRTRAEVVVVTEKDLARMGPMLHAMQDIRVETIPMDAQLQRQEEFAQWLRGRLRPILGREMAEIEDI
jgi:tetraacyldisaccharide 4'-kinase